MQSTAINPDLTKSIIWVELKISTINNKFLICHHVFTSLSRSPGILPQLSQCVISPSLAGMVKYPAEYPWSSYHFNLSKSNSLIKEHITYTASDMDRANRLSAYSALFEN